MNNRKQRNKIQLGTAWTLWGTTPPPPIPERVLDGIPGFLAWFAFLFSIASAVAFPRTLLLIAALLGAYTAIRFFLATVAASRGLEKIKEAESTDWKAQYLALRDEQSLDWELVQHLLIIPNYKEELTILRRSLDALKIQHQAKKRLTIILAMEAGEAGCVEKAESLISDYAEDFKAIYYTVHPSGLAGEMQCKSANEAWAARWAKRHLVDELGYELDHICVTTMDADTRWHPKYFYALTALFATDAERYNRFWQAPMRYHGNIWEINPLLQIVNAYATAFELAYLASPWWLAMPMSSYSLSLRLLDNSGYWDGDVIADEWHMFIKAYFVRGGKLSLKEIMLPFLADTTVGKGVLGELKERYLQTLRHAWGSKEMGYMIAKMIDHPEVEFRPALRLLFRISHDILMAGAGWVLITVGSQLPVLLHPEIAPVQLSALLENPPLALQTAFQNILADPAWLILVSASLGVLVLAFYFWLLDMRVRPPRNRPLTFMERVWTVLSFPLMPILTLIVLAIPTIQAQSLLLIGIPLQFRVSKKV